MDSLAFHKDAFADLLEEDGLLAMGRGLGLERILLSFLRLYCDPKCLVFVLNVRPGSEEHTQLLEDLQLLDPTLRHPPRTVSSGESAEQRNAPLPFLWLQQWLATATQAAADTTAGSSTSCRAGCSSCPLARSSLTF